MTALLLLGIAPAAHTQFDHKELAELLQTDLESQYPNQPAVILFDQGRLEFRNERIVFRVQRQILVLNPEGLKYGQVRVQVSGNQKEVVEMLQARTLRLNPGGKIGVYPSTKKSIRTRNLPGGGQEYLVSAPFLQLGDVVEYGYELSVPNVSALPVWRFQHEIPVMYSVFSLLAPQEYRFTKFFVGDPNQVSVSQSYVSRPVNQFQSVRNPELPPSWAYGRTENATISLEEFEARDLPPIPKEIFAGTPENYALALRLQLASKAFGANTQLRAFQTWPDIHQYLVRHRQFFRVRLSQAQQSAISAAMLRANRGRPLTPEVIYLWVRDEMAWNNNYDILARSLNKVWEEKNGTGSDINLLLFALLRGAGFQAAPVLIATRDRGRLEPLFPSLDQFNHVIVRLFQNGKEIFLDATEKEVPFGLLPKKDLNEQGFLITRERGRWIEVAPFNAKERKIISQLNLLPDGRFTGEVHMEINPLTRLLEIAHPDTSFAAGLRSEGLLGGMAPERLDVLAVENEETPELPLLVDCSVLTSAFGNISDNYLIFNPLMRYAQSENPLPNTERRSPVELSYPVREYYLIGIRIPPGYEIVSAPHPFRVEMVDKAGSYAYDVLQQDGIVHISSVFILNRTRFEPHDYPGLVQFFQLMTDKQQESVVLRKKEMVTPGG